MVHFYFDITGTLLGSVEEKGTGPFSLRVRSCGPFQLEFPLVQRAVPEVQIDEVLVRHSQLLGEILEISHGRRVQAYRDRLLQLLDVRVLLALHLVEIVVLSHRLSPVVPVGCGFLPVCLACRDDPDDGVIDPKAVAYDQHPQFDADPEHQEPILVGRMVRVEEPDGILVQEDGLRLFE